MDVNKEIDTTVNTFFEEVNNLLKGKPENISSTFASLSSTREKSKNMIVKLEKISKEIDQNVNLKRNASISNIDKEVNDSKDSKYSKDTKDLSDMKENKGMISKYDDKILNSFSEFEEINSIYKSNEQELYNLENLLNFLIESLLKSTVALVNNCFKSIRRCFNLLGSNKLNNFKKIKEYIQIFLQNINKIDVNILGIENVYSSKNKDDHGTYLINLKLS